MKLYKTILRVRNYRFEATGKITFFALFVAMSMTANVIWAASPGSVETGEIVVEVLNIKSKKGNLLINLFNSPEGFPIAPEKALQQLNIKVKNISRFVKIKSVRVGNYAISVCHDENSNNVCDTNLLGIPKEGVGVSNNAKGFMGPPKYADSMFRLNVTGKEIKIKLSY
ncbi:MAG: DUF2141 domain-containing protein [Leptospirales bacterium]